jgi:hypothetical protein
MPCGWLYAFAMARSLFIISLTSLTTLVPACGRLCLHQRINISTVLAGQRPGIKEIDDGIWLVSFMHYELGYFDLEQNPLQPLDCRHSYSKFLAKLAWSSSELRQSWRVLLLDLEGVDDREIRGKLQWIVSVYLGDVALT